MARETRAVPSACKYCVRWLGFPLGQDTWEPRSSLLRDVPDVVRAYELMGSFHPDMLAKFDALIHHESKMVMQDVENENNAETENVVMTSFHHDRANENFLRGARRGKQANVSPLYTEHPTETGYFVGSHDASVVPHVVLRPFIH